MLWRIFALFSINHPRGVKEPAMVPSPFSLVFPTTSIGFFSITEIFQNPKSSKPYGSLLTVNSLGRRNEWVNEIQNRIQTIQITCFISNPTWRLNWIGSDTKCIYSLIKTSLLGGSLFMIRWIGNSMWGCANTSITCPAIYTNWKNFYFTVCIF